MSVFRSDRGTSLMEVITVSALVAIVTAIAVPSITTLSGEASLPSVQREVMAALYIARSSAITYNAQRTVVFTPPRLIEIKDQNSSIIYTRDLNVYGTTVSIGSNSSLSAAPIIITFNSLGMITVGNPVTITLINLQGQHKTVTVYTTGKAAAS